MEKFLAFLDTVSAIATNIAEVKPRVTATVNEAQKILNAISAADLGNTERAVVTRLSDITGKIKAILG